VKVTDRERVMKVKERERKGMIKSRIKIKERVPNQKKQEENKVKEDGDAL
jgi:hypothetical protein